MNPSNAPGSRQIGQLLPPEIRQKPREQMCMNMHERLGETLNLQGFFGSLLRS
jgi:hypothetical protein